MPSSRMLGRLTGRIPVGPGREFRALAPRARFTSPLARRSCGQGEPKSPVVALLFDSGPACIAMAQRFGAEVPWTPCSRTIVGVLSGATAGRSGRLSSRGAWSPCHPRSWPTVRRKLWTRDGVPSGVDLRFALPASPVPSAGPSRPDCGNAVWSTGAQSPGQGVRPPLCGQERGSARFVGPWP